MKPPERLHRLDSQGEVPEAGRAGPGCSWWNGTYGGMDGLWESQTSGGFLGPAIFYEAYVLKVLKRFASRGTASYMYRERRILRRLEWVTVRTTKVPSIDK